MPTITSYITNTIQDGISEFNGNYNTGPWDVNNGINSVAVFYGPQSWYAKISYFCFKIDNLDQGSNLSNVQITVPMNGGPYNNGSSSRIYVIVENNLNVEPVAGTDRIIRGTRGKTPWDRIGRITESVTAYGNRCGPTHSHPSGLAGYGANVRSPYAHIYKAFCDDQGTAGANGYSIPANSKVTSVNFAPALQALVDDPGWNSTSQWVMVYLFSDLAEATGAELGGVGNMAGLTYHNGMAPSNKTTSGQGQVQNYQGQVHTQSYLTIDYTSVDLSSKSSKSVSSGFVSLGGTPKLLGRLYGDRMEYSNFGAVMPGDGGAHDLPFTGMYTTANPFGASWVALTGNLPTETHVKMDQFMTRIGRVDGRIIYINDSVYKTASLWWNMGKYHSGIVSLKSYSLRFYHGYTNTGSPPSSGTYNEVVRFRKEGSTKFYLRLNPTNIDPFTFNWRHQIVDSVGTGHSSVGSYPIYTKGSRYFYRYEIQVSEYTNPKVKIRVYNDDDTTPLEVLTANPSSVDADVIEFGDFTSGFAGFSVQLSDIEIWSDYYLNNQFSKDLSSNIGTPMIPKGWKWFELASGDERHELEEVGTVTSVQPDGTDVVLSSANKLLYEDYTGLYNKGDNTYTKHSNLEYGSGSYRRLDLYVPDGTPPAGGWPVLIFSHGGFFIDGSRNVVSGAIADNICGVGRYALASISYVLCEKALNSYPAYNTSSPSGKFPSFILNFKEAAHYITTIASTYGINASKMIASGVSAGGYLALGAATSRNIVSDSKGRNLTLAGNTGSFLTPNVPDPIFLGAYAWCPPVSLASLVSYDPTWHTSNPYPMEGSAAGRMETTSRLFMGMYVNQGFADTSGTGIDELIRLNPSNQVPIAHEWGSSDFLVPSNKHVADAHSQDKLLQSAINDVAGSLPPGFTYTSIENSDAVHHSLLGIDFDIQPFLKWMKEITGN